MNNRQFIFSISFATGLALSGCGDDGASAVGDDDTTGDAATSGPATTDTPTSGDGPTSGATTSAETGMDGTTVDPDSTGGSTGQRSGPRVDPPALAGQIDRAGRAAISTATIETFQADEQLAADTKDAYNAAAPDEWATYIPQMMSSLAILDALDATCGTQLLVDAGANRYELLATVLSDDRLWVNSDSGTCGVYLGVEAEAVGEIGPGEGGCGGRTPADDVIERSYSVLAAGILAGIDDGVTADDGMQTRTFPFLGAPQ